MEKHKFVAHIAEDGREQSVKAHLEGAAAIAKKCLERLKLGDAAYLAAIVHDAGKYTERYQDYLRSASDGLKVRRGSVIHSFTGLGLLLERFHDGENSIRLLSSELLAYAVGAHHGLFDCINEEGKSGFLHRIDRQDIDYEEGRDNYFEDCLSPKELDFMFDGAAAELEPIIMELISLIRGQDLESQSELFFYFGLLERLLLSAVIEGDRSDTAGFMNGKEAFEARPENEELWTERLAFFENKLKAFTNRTALDTARAEISEKCSNAAHQKGGIYRLNVPTGAGKTLASARFALTYAKEHQKSRIVFTSPLLSILEQNAAVLREFIGDDSIILEHHSNVVRSESGLDELDKYELLKENWNSPIIITTLVQLLDTLFSGKTSCIRRFNRLCESVIIIDEAQTVPSNMLSLFNLAMNFLAKVCGAVIVLCSATQPCLEETIHPISLEIRDIVAYDAKLWEIFRRTRIIDAGAMTQYEIARFALQKLLEVNSLLIVCNKKDEAEELFHMLSAEVPACFHLSASMCPDHRRETVDLLKSSLERSRAGVCRTLCISTQVIEAGVDISFDCAIRFAAGLDNVIQTAGRCNRNGESSTPMPVYIIRSKGENLSRLKDIRRAKDASEELLEQYRRSPESYGNELSGDKAVSEYYRCLYREMAKTTGLQDFPLQNEKGTIYSLLSFNNEFRGRIQGDEPSFYMPQAFRYAGNAFHVFDESTEDVIVPYKEGIEIIRSINSGKAQSDMLFMKELIKRAKPYTVTVYKYQLELLHRQGALHLDSSERIYWLDEAFYNADTGLSVHANQSKYLEE